jgi:hypothetical protein
MTYANRQHLREVVSNELSDRSSRGLGAFEIVVRAVAGLVVDSRIGRVERRLLVEHVERYEEAARGAIAVPLHCRTELR